MYCLHAKPKDYTAVPSIPNQGYVIQGAMQTVGVKAAQDSICCYLFTAEMGIWPKADQQHTRLKVWEIPGLLNLKILQEIQLF